MRSLFAILIAVAQVAGPWLCCCGPAQAFAAAPPAVTTEADGEACPHCAKLRDRGAEPAARPHAPAPGPDRPSLPGRCPCCAVKVVDAVAVDAARDADAVAALFAFPPPVLALLAPTADVPATAAVASLPGLCDSAFLTTEARLYSHHALRC